MSALTSFKRPVAGIDHLACPLEEQPSYLVPRNRYPVAPSTTSLTVNPLCKFYLAKSDRHHRGSAWVVDPATGLVSLFTFGSTLGSVLRELKPGDAAPRAITGDCLRVLLQAGILISPRDVRARRKTWTERQSRLRRQFERHGHVQLAGLIHPFVLGELRLHYRRLIRTGGMAFGDPQTSGRYAAHNEAAARAVHHQLTGMISNLAGERVKPSYAYVVSYQGGAVLTEHVDREQCEFSVSLLLDYTPECRGPSPWPLCLRKSREVRISQKIGDAVLYRGRSLPHFRDRLPEDATSTSMLLHYVPSTFRGSLD